MKTKTLFTLTIDGLMAVGLMTTAWPQNAYVEKTVTSVSAAKTVPVTWENFVRAESDKMTDNRKGCS
jgi:hypothetical protein